MHTFTKYLLASLGLSMLASPAAHAQLGLGTGTTAPRTMLDVNGAIATAETGTLLTGNNPSYTIAASVGQLLLAAGSSVPTGTIALASATSPGPVVGQRLVVYNATAIPATLGNYVVAPTQTIEFVYSSNAWRPSGDGGNALAVGSGLTKSPTNVVSLGGSLASTTTVALASNNLNFSGTGQVGIGVTDPTQVLDVNGTARLRNIPGSGGTVMLTADNNGVIRQQALPTASAPSITGTLGDGVTLNSNNWGGFNYTGSYIVIPANSKYLVQGFFLLSGSAATTSSQSVWVRSSFAESSSGSFAQSGDIVGSPYISGLLASNANYSMMSGAVVIQNRTNAAKTYYYWAGTTIVTGNFTGTINSVGSRGWAEDQLIALPIN